MSSLSSALLDAGFFSALGTTERIGERPQIVRAGGPFTWNQSGHIVVICDEFGHPWILLEELDRVSATLRARGGYAGHRLKLGAYVPHAQDDGFFLREVLPTLKWTERPV